jgi:hypothetical protein
MIIGYYQLRRKIVLSKNLKTFLIYICQDLRQDDLHLTEEK